MAHTEIKIAITIKIDSDNIAGVIIGGKGSETTKSTITVTDKDREPIIGCESRNEVIDAIAI